MKLGGKNVVYVGGCGGIGAATCKLLIQQGIANLVIFDLNENPELIPDFKHQSPSTAVIFLKVDVANKDSVEKCLNEVISRINRIDVLVNGSGIFDDFNPKRTMDVNLLGVIYTTLAAVELMDKSKGGHGGLILNIGSIAGLDPFAQAPIYSTSKAGVVMFTRNLADDFHYQRTGVSFVVICPGVTKTKLIDDFNDVHKGKHVSAIRMLAKENKTQKPEDCARHIVKAIEVNKNGTVYVSYAGGMREVPMQNWYVAAKM